MNGSDTDRLRLAMEAARLECSHAYQNLKAAMDLFGSLPPGSPDGTEALRQARAAYRKTMDTYNAAVRAYAAAVLGDRDGPK